MADIGTRIRKGDTVRVIAGKDRGKEGKVITAIAPVENPRKPRPARLFIEGVNIITKHVRRQPQQNASPTSDPTSHGRVQKEAPVYASKVMVICPSCGKPVRIAVKTAENGKRYRACKSCEKAID